MSDVFSNGPLVDGELNNQQNTTPNSDRKNGIKQWGPIEAIVLSAFLYVVLQFFVGLLIVPLLWSQGKQSGGIDVWLTSIHNQFLYYLAWVILAVTGLRLYIRKYNQNIKNLGINRLSWRFLWYGLAGVVTYYVLYIIAVTIISELIPILNIEQKQDLGFQAPTALSEYASAFVMLVILPPIIEELIFRGFMFKGFRRSLAFLPAAIFTSILFAIGHLEFGNGAPLLWIAGVDTFILSMVMCYVREKTNSIWPTIFMHAVKNMIAFTFLYLLTI